VKIQEKYFTKLVDFIGGFVINLIVFSISTFFIEITFSLALLYSLINALLMPFYLFPLLKKANMLIENRKRKNQYVPIKDYYKKQAENRIELEKGFEELKHRENKLLKKYKYDWKLYRKFLNKSKIDFVYHFTDKSNLESIIKNNGLFSLKAIEKNNIIISKSGGNELSHKLDRKKHLENYIRLSFTPKHPMMYFAMNDGRINEPVILKINSEVIYWLESKYSDNNATNRLAKIGDDFKSLPLSEIEIIKNIDYFDSPEEYKKYYQAEILIKEKIPLEYIENISEYIEQ